MLTDPALRLFLVLAGFFLRNAVLDRCLGPALAGRLRQQTTAGHGWVSAG